MTIFDYIIRNGIYVLFYGEEAPRTHNIWIVLKKILESSLLIEVVNTEKFRDEITVYKLFFADLVFYYISERYPSYKEKLSASISKEKANEVLKKAKEVFEWLRFLEKYGK